MTHSKDTYLFDDGPVVHTHGEQVEEGRDHVRLCYHPFRPAGVGATDDIGQGTEDRQTNWITNLSLSI